MEIIKQLREMTGAGIVDCKKALDEANNDLRVAVEILRKKGIAKAAKRIDRETNEGVVKVAVAAAAGEAYIFELTSETDFVSRNDKFQKFADEVMDLVLSLRPENLEALLSLPMAESNVKDNLAVLSGTIGEKMEIRRFARLHGASLAAYSHLGGKLGVLVALDQAGKEELAMTVAMQVAAANPKYIEPSEVEAGELEKEKEIYREQLLKEGKPEAMIEKILEGKVTKYYSEVCLVEQEFIKDDKKKVKDILGGAKILGFVRFSL
ncbi:MAG TPA: translation elongation factor Ts [bacterium]|jgi:elongation factor Ts|nr:MAG: Elongation factor Ts [Parcubacteria group bacterium ADurb.Bin115]HNU81682.1 translation elongation factor Ts [bacterium]HPW05414.1 translation elongation factor Ts [bacterium]HPY99771.1 translation elongation factor Ts [bacterium]HQB76251.1 translation elongation factor Ts [bacterium]